MKPIVAAFASAVLLAACAAGTEKSEDGVRSVKFGCANGERIEMRFFPAQGVGVLVRHGKPIELQQQPAASGFVYSNGPNTVRGKGDELIVEIGRMAPLKCQAE